MSTLIKKTAIRNFLKEQTAGLRIGVNAIDHLSTLLVSTVVHVTARAQESAIDGKRNTIMARDIQYGFESFLQTQGPSLYTAAAIHRAIDNISNEELTKLIIELNSKDTK